MQAEDKSNKQEEASKTLYLIDGYASIFRAFYAIRHPLYSPVTGEPTQAVLVFTQMLLKLYAVLKPDYVVVALDSPGATFREELYADYVQAAVAATSASPSSLPPPEVIDKQDGGESITQSIIPTTLPAEVGPHIPATPSSEPRYKGTRRATPDALGQQIKRIHELLRVFSIPVIGKQGLEADDIIATITDRIQRDPRQDGIRVRIVSRDKDLEQLLTDRVTLFDIHTGLETDRAALHHKRGIRPEQVVDFLALTGDVVDNIPGVQGIGARGAAKLLEEFGSLEGVFENLDRVNSRWRQSLQQARPLLPFSRRLLTLKQDAELPFNLEEARVRAFPAAELSPMFEELGFHRLKEQLPRSPAQSASALPAAAGDEAVTRVPS